MLSSLEVQRFNAKTQEDIANLTGFQSDGIRERLEKLVKKNEVTGLISSTLLYIIIYVSTNKRSETNKDCLKSVKSL